MAALLTDCGGMEFNAEFVNTPVIVFQCAVGDELYLCWIIEVEPSFQHVLSQQFRRILNAVSLLLRAARRGKNAAVDDGIAARSTHLLQDNYACTRLAGFNGCSKPCKAGAYYNDVIRFIPRFLFWLFSLSAGHSAETRADKEIGGILKECAT